ncbi:UNVERIFIED_CONTAM: hypothetical protein Sangu_0964300 [Sesamum angustifolium]|uniref:Uncharacterized protein n=1 Tax=Sesamum angustifolium TaxID=2727405 RepID=A0AAW2PFC0_9LAMI
MDTIRLESLRRWVWEANRGNPMENNVFTRHRWQSSLGRVAWKSNTDVVGFELLPNGNMPGLEPKRFAMYYTSKNSPNTMLYFDSMSYLIFGKWSLDVLTFNSQPETEDAFAYEFKCKNSNSISAQIQ